MITPLVLLDLLSIFMLHFAFYIDGVATSGLEFFFEILCVEPGERGVWSLSTPFNA